MDLQAVANEEGFAASSLLGEMATSEAVTASIVHGSTSLADGDLFVVSFSGYGGYVRDEQSSSPFKTWALYDRQMPEYELLSLLGRFPSGVRILVLSDSCAYRTISRSISSVYEHSETGTDRVELSPLTSLLPPTRPIRRSTSRSKTRSQTAVRRRLKLPS